MLLLANMQPLGLLLRPEAWVQVLAEGQRGRRSPHPLLASGAKMDVRVNPRSMDENKLLGDFSILGYNCALQVQLRAESSKAVQMGVTSHKASRCSHARLLPP